jgi:hypothetical protein
MTRRRTMQIRELLDKANHMLAASTCEPAGRQAICCFIESILHETGHYRGYNALTIDRVPRGHRPGINLGPAGEWLDNMDARNADVDDTRRAYHYHPNLI